MKANKYNSQVIGIFADLIDATKHDMEIYNIVCKLLAALKRKGFLANNQKAKVKIKIKKED